MTTPRILGQLGPVLHYDFNGTLAVAKGDLMYHAADDVRPFAQQADGGTLAANQISAAKVFAGVAAEAKLVTQTAADTEFPVCVDCEVEIDCTSATFEVGDLVGPEEDSGGTYLENQKVAKVTTRNKAIGVVTKRYASATTRVRCRLMANVANYASPFPVGTTISDTAGDDATGVNAIIDRLQDARIIA